MCGAGVAPRLAGCGVSCLSESPQRELTVRRDQELGGRGDPDRTEADRRDPMEKLLERSIKLETYTDAKRLACLSSGVGVRFWAEIRRWPPFGILLSGST